MNRARTGQADLATWAPAVDIYETENELVVKADLPDVDEKDIDVRVENNMLTIRGERKFEKNVNEDNYLRVERTYGAFTAELLAAEYGEHRGHSRRVSQRRADRAHAEARGVQAEAGQGQRFGQRKVSS